MRANDTLIGVLLIVVSLAILAYSTTFPEFPGQNFGPSLFPRILAGGLIICGGLLMLQGMASRRTGQPWLYLAPWTREPGRIGSFLLVPALLLFYILTSETVGFLPIAILCIGAMLLWLGVKPLTAVATAVIATIVIHWFFASMLRVPLPRGWLTEFL